MECTWFKLKGKCLFCKSDCFTNNYQLSTINMKLQGHQTKFTNPKLTPAQKDYLKRQSADPYVQAAHAAGYRSRAAFKFLEIMEKEPFLKTGMVVVDLGCTPGGWCQVAAPRVGEKG